MKRLDVWQEAPLPDAAFEFQQAFAMNTMTFLQWLQFIFVPRIENLLESGGP